MVYIAILSKLQPLVCDGSYKKALLCVMEPGRLVVIVILNLVDGEWTMTRLHLVITSSTPSLQPSTRTYPTTHPPFFLLKREYSPTLNK